MSEAILARGIMPRYTQAMNIIGISGSLRAKSYNTALLRACQTLVPSGMTLEIVSIDGLPVYNEDLESQFPTRVRELRESITKADGVILAVPEFNRAPSGAIKNFLDWSSRPESEPNPWAKRPVAVFGCSSGPRGASFAQYDVRRTLHYFDANVMNQSETYIGVVQDKFDDLHTLADERTKQQLQKFLAAFAAHVSGSAR